MTFVIDFFLYKILKLRKKALQICFFFTCFENESIEINDFAVMSLTVEMAVCNSEWMNSDMKMFHKMSYAALTGESVRKMGE